MSASQGDLDDLSIPQLELIIADRRRRESQRIMRTIAGREGDRNKTDAGPRRSALDSGLAAPQGKPAGGNATARLSDLEEAGKSSVQSATQARGASAAALFGPERFERSSLASIPEPKRQRGPAWMRNSSFSRVFDVGLLLAEVGFVLLLLYVVGQWLVTDAQVSDDASIAALSKPGVSMTRTPRAAAAIPPSATVPAIVAASTSKATASRTAQLPLAEMTAASGSILGVNVAATLTPSPTPTYALIDPWGESVSEEPLLQPNPAATIAAVSTPTATPPANYWGDTVPLNPEPTPTVTALVVDTNEGWTDAVTFGATPPPTATPTVEELPTATFTPEPPTPTATPDSTLKLPIELSIPKIGIDIRVREVDLVMSADQTTWEVADFMAGHHNGTANPGETGNMVLAGHRDIRGSVFRDLDKLAPGDEIFVASGRGIVYRYVVRTSLVVRPDAVSVMAPTDDMRLTLITCTPVKIASHRLVIVADLDPNYTRVAGDE